MGALTLDAGSTTRMEINGTTPGTGHDQIVVGGTATLAGTLDLLFGFTPSNGDTFTLIDAASITGDFAAVTNSLGNALVYETLISDDYVLSILATQTDFAPFAQTPNQQAVGSALDGGEWAEPGPLDLVNYLNGLPGSSLPAAFDQIAPEELAIMANMGFANTRGVFHMLRNRMGEIRNGQRFSANGLTLWDESREFQQSLLASTADWVPGTQIYQPAVKDDRLGVFVSGEGTFGDVDGDGNADGYDFSTGGVILGVDHPLAPGVAVGAYAGYQGSEANTSAQTEIASDTARFGIYTTLFQEKGSWLSANIGGALTSYDTERSAAGGTASGDTDGMEINAQLVIGHDFKAGNFTFGPELEAGYTHLWIDGFTESGSLAPLAIQDQNADSMRTTLAARASYDWKLESLTLQPMPGSAGSMNFWTTTRPSVPALPGGAMRSSPSPDRPWPGMPSWPARGCRPSSANASAPAWAIRPRRMRTTNCTASTDR